MSQADLLRSSPSSWRTPWLVLGPMLGLGCGMNADLLGKAQIVFNQHGEVVSLLEQTRQQYEQDLDRSVIPNVHESAERAQLTEGFDAASRHIDDMQPCITRLDTLIRDNRRNTAAETREQITICSQFLTEAQRQLALPSTRLEDWEALYASASAKEAAAKLTTQAALAELQAEMQASKAPLKQLVTQQQQAYPNKEADLAARSADLLLNGTQLASHLDTVEAQASAIAVGAADKVDILTFATALAEVNVIAGLITASVDDLYDRLEQLDESWVLTVTRLEKYPTYRIQLLEYSWTSNDYGDGRKRDLGWSQITERQFFENAKYRLDAVYSQSGSDYGSGTETEVFDREIVYTHFATTLEVSDGEAHDVVRSEIDEGTWWDYYEAALDLDEAFPEAGIVTSQESSAYLDPEDDAPVQVVMDLRLTVEQKFIGQYEDEASDSPTPVGVALGLIGNEEYGEWHGEGTNRTWLWHGVMAGYVFGSGWSTYGGRDQYDKDDPYWDHHRYLGYSRWRSAGGWSEDFDETGAYQRRAYTKGSNASAYRSGALKSARGAGPASRARGMGGGGK